MRRYSSAPWITEKVLNLLTVLKVTIGFWSFCRCHIASNVPGMGKWKSILDYRVELYDIVILFISSSFFCRFGEGEEGNKNNDCD